MTRAAGSRTTFDLLRRRRSHESDEQVLASGTPLSISCFLRGSSENYPRKFRQGMLTLAGGKATWKPFWSFRRRPIAISEQVNSLTTRPRDDASDWNIKSSGVYKPGSLLQSSAFSVVALSTATGTIEMAVPALDGTLVAKYFSS